MRLQERCLAQATEHFLHAVHVMPASAAGERTVLVLCYHDNGCGLLVVYASMNGKQTQQPAACEYHPRQHV